MVPRVVEPGDEGLHFFLYGGGWRSLKMNLPFVDRARDNLHWILVRSVDADGFQIPPSGCEHAVPPEQAFVRERSGEAAVEIRHHVGNALFGGGNSAAVGIEPEISPDGRLDAVAVEKLALDFRGLDRLVADQVHGKSALIVLTDVAEGTQQKPAAKQEPCFPGFEDRPVETELRPVILLPIPSFLFVHDL